jgi:hypothetical protein
MHTRDIIQQPAAALSVENLTAFSETPKLSHTNSGMPVTLDYLTARLVRVSLEHSGRCCGVTLGSPSRVVIILTPCDAGCVDSGCPWLSKSH